MTRLGVSASRRPSMNAASVSLDGNPECSVGSSTRQSACAARACPVYLLRGTLRRFSLLLMEPFHMNFMVAVSEHFRDHAPAHACTLELAAKHRQELVDALVDLLGRHVQELGDVRHFPAIPETELEQELVVRLEAGDHLVDEVRRRTPCLLPVAAHAVIV